MNNKKNSDILVVGSTPPPYNGMSVATNNFLSSNIPDQFEIILLDTADRRGLGNVGHFDWHNISLALGHGLQFLWLLLKHRPEVIYISIAQNTLGYLRDALFLIPSRLFRSRVVVHLHGSALQAFYQASHPGMKALIRWTLAKVECAIVLGENLRDCFDGLVPAERVRVVPNGIDVPPIFEEKVHQEDIQPSKGRKVVFLGALTRTKGFIQVIESAKWVLEEESSVHFTIAGEHCCPEDLQEAFAIVQNKGLGDHIELPGALIGNEKEQLLREADIFVFPPIAPEGQPLVLLEAMAAGLPIITTDQGAIKETIEDRVNGYIVPANNAEAIAEKILVLLNDQSLRQRMGQASRDRFLKHFTVERWAEDLNQIFLAVTNR